jgi:uncharacterized protein (DUF2141 family)
MKRLPLLPLIILIVFISNVSFAVETFNWTRMPLIPQTQYALGQAGGEGFQMIFDLRIAPSNTGTAYFVTDTNGVWKTTNLGSTTAQVTWNPCWNGYGFGGAASIGISPTDPNFVLVAGSDMLVSPLPENIMSGIAKTTDGGVNWSIATSTFYSSAIGNNSRYFKRDIKGKNLFAFIPGSTTVYCGTTYKGLLISQDSGSTWALANSKSQFNNGEISDIKLHPTTNDMYICTTGGFYKKIGNGTPSLITTGCPASPIHLAIDQNTPNNFFFLVYADAAGSVYRSTVGGTSSVKINSSSMDTDKTNGYIFGSLELEQNSNNLYASLAHNPLSGKLYRTTNALAATPTWSQPNNLDTDGICAAISGGTQAVDGQTPIVSVPGASGTVYCTNASNEVLRSTDAGDTWTYCNNGYIGAAMGNAYSKTPMGYATSTAAGTPTYVMGYGDFGLFTSNGATVTAKNEPKKNILGLSVTPGTTTPRIVVAASDAADPTTTTLYYSDDLGSTYIICSGGSAGVHHDDEGGHRNIFWHPNKTTVYAGSARSTDGGKTFSYPSGSSNGSVVRDMSPDGTCLLICGVGGGNWLRYVTNAGTYTASDYWSRAQIDMAGSSIVDVCLSATKNNRIYALDAKVASPGVWTIDWFGTGTIKTLTTITGAIDAHGDFDPYTLVSDKNIIAGNQDILYAIGPRYHPRYRGSGLWRSVDGNLTWSNISGSTTSNIKGVSPTGIFINPVNRYIILTSFNGSWQLPPPGFVPSDVVESANKLICKPTADTITIDGSQNEGVWNLANSITLNKAINGTPTTVGSVTVKALYSSTGIYLLASILDPNLHADSADSVSYHDSSCELYIDGNYDRSVPQLEAATDRKLMVGYNRSLSQIQFLPAAGTTTGVNYAWGTQTGGYKEEWYIPFSNFGYPGGTSTMPQTTGGTVTIGFDVFYNEDSNGGTRDGQVGWSGTDTNYLDTRYYGDLHFGTQSVTAGGGGSAPTVVTGTVTPIGTSSATLNGTITANNLTTDAWFKYGTQSGNLTGTTSTSQFTGSTPGTLSKAITGLSQSTTYYYQAVGSNTAGIVNGSESSFVTGSVPSIGTMTGCTNWWKFDEGTGSSTADSVGTNTGTLVNNGSWTVNGKVPKSGSGTWTTGAVSPAISLDGVDDKVTMNQMIGSPTQYSMSGWAYVIGSDTTGASLVSIGDYVGISTHNNTVPNMNQTGFRYDGTTWRSTGSNTVSPFNQWHHWVFSVDDTNNSQTLYIDGVYGTTSTWAANTSWSGQGTQTVIGAHGKGGLNADLQGYIDDVRIFQNKAISAQEAIDLFTIPVITGAGSATAITSSSCTFVGTAATNGSISANIYVQYGTQSGTYTGTTTPQINLVGSTTSSGASWAVTGLTAGTTTYYRLQIVSDAYTVSGGEGSFTTAVIAGAPVSVTYPATIIGSQTVTINGSSTPTGLSTTALFQYGTSSNYTGTSSTFDAGAGVSAVNVSKTITGLSQGTLYVYRLQSTNGSGTANGSELSFTTTDTTIPTGTITINNGAIGINSGSATVLMEATDNTGIVAYSLQGTSTNPGVGSWTTVATTTSFISAVPYNLSLGEGTKQIWGWFKDGWGNTSTVSTDTIILDTTDPTIMITSPTSASTYNAMALSVTLGGTATDSGSLLASIDWINSQTGGTGTTSGTSTWSASSIPLTTGVNTITVVATDNAGNVGSDVINVTGGYSLEQVTGISKPLSWSLLKSTKFLNGMKNYGIYNWETVWRSTQRRHDLITNPDTEITNAIDNR